MLESRKSARVETVIFQILASDTNQGSFGFCREQRLTTCHLRISQGMVFHIVKMTFDCPKRSNSELVDDKIRQITLYYLLFELLHHSFYIKSNTNYIYGGI